MISEDRALEIAGEFLRTSLQPRANAELAIDMEHVHEIGKYLIVGFNTRAYLETRKLKHILTSGTPLIVDLESGECRKMTDDHLEELSAYLNARDATSGNAPDN
jgi:Immunity protein 35